MGRHRRRRHGRTECRVAARQARVSGFRSAGDEREAGGNARSGENEITAFPWAAHYVPVPDKGDLCPRAVRGTGRAAAMARGRSAICASLRRSGFHPRGWQDGIEPAIGLTPEDREQFRRWNSMIAQFRADRRVHDPDGTRVHAESPSSTESLWLTGLCSSGSIRRMLRWYVNYVAATTTAHWRRTRRRGQAFTTSRRASRTRKGPLTWPEGNGWIANAADRKGCGLTSDRVRCATVSRAPVIQLRVLTAQTEYRPMPSFAAPTFLATYICRRFRAARTLNIRHG